jgi:Fe-S-cluster containining protein
MAEENLCDRCTALCCRYFALGIDEPDTPEEFDDIRWYLAHENVHVFIEDDDWYLSIQTRCQHLMDDNRCGIYEDRPKICRKYTTDNCDYYTGSYDFEQYFTKPEQIEAYAQATLGDLYTRYVVRQRMANIGQAADSGDRPKGKSVLASRARPHVKGHPSRTPRRRVMPPAGAVSPAALVNLSVGAPRR